MIGQLIKCFPNNPKPKIKNLILYDNKEKVVFKYL